MSRHWHIGHMIGSVCFSEILDFVKEGERRGRKENESKSTEVIEVVLLSSLGATCHLHPLSQGWFPGSIHLRRSHALLVSILAAKIEYYLFMLLFSYK